MFHGSMAALVTPMLADGSVDYKRLAELAAWHVESGTNALLVAGSTGEGNLLTDQEKAKAIDVVAKQVNSEIPVIANSGAVSTADTIKLTKLAMAHGADGCLISTPPYIKPTQAGLYAHFTAIAEAEHLPIILYNVPGRTGCDLLPETVAKLADLSNIVGLKEATGSMDRLAELQQVCDGKIDLFSGDDPTAVEFMLRGGRGVISISANVAPKAMATLSQLALTGDKDAALALNEKLAPLHQAMIISSNPIPCKWALAQMGKIEGHLRLPLLPLEAQFYETVQTAMQQAEVL